ncbi:hypothetical protein like AT1G26610 [Hibiscus trionum]|uniref:C2H2-type domain-containing protein n=1 Tax=Hibiscus trionum TaxID=183268 RepID=A0A9W7JI31_HIBTR|nr:hypothetical protein like AT1G26610 [Hibiscus trionum]
MEELKYGCKFCSKSFPSGRSLGGHMRSHLNNNSNSVEADDKFCKKKLVSVLNNVVQDSNTDETGNTGKDGWVHDKVCKECGKGFQSWQALFGHMKYHSDKEKGAINSLGEQDSWINGDQKMVFDTQSDNETGKKRRSKRRTRFIATANCPMSEVEQRQEQEEVALSLMMLSRDVRHWVGLNYVAESSNNNSFFLEAKIQIKSSSKPGVNSVNHKSGVSADCRKNKISVDQSNMKKTPAYDQTTDANKRSKFECTSCKKIFHSYQALGGHRASHKRTKGCFGSDSSETTAEIEAAEDGNLVKSIRHECPICLKVFPSGQALGGHKRSHFVAAEAKDLIRPENRDFLDLNLPAAAVEEGSSVHMGLKPWWAGATQKHRPLLGLIYN